MAVEGTYHHEGDTIETAQLTLIDDHTKDMCPICKTDKYLSPNMKFLINPECYHKICESCVDRIFSLGPSTCPYPNCGKILRKNKFKTQVFEDLAIEREIDIRLRVSAVYNKTQEDFELLEDFNVHLENVETIVYNLSNKIDVEETESALNAYEQDHKIEILEKNMRESQKSANIQQYQEAMERLKQEKVRIQKQMELEDADYQRQQQLDLLDKLTNSSGLSSEELIKQQHAISLKRSTMRKKQLQHITTQLDQQFSSTNPLSTVAQDEEKPPSPFTPFMGDREINKNFDLLPVPNEVEELLHIENHISGSYYDPYVNKLAQDRSYLACGWRLEAVFTRALDEAFTGLGCFIEKEKAVIL